jgi:LacI family transcriptional regulator
MPGRPTITDLAAAAGVSVATVDRVLNRRHPVRVQTAERVLAAAQAIGFHAATLIRQRIGAEVPERTFGFLLQKHAEHFYRDLASNLQAATTNARDIRGRALVEFIEELSPTLIADCIRDLGTRADALAVVSVDHPHVSAAIAALKDGGVPTFAIVTDLTAESRAGYIGRDNRKEGRTAAWMMAKAARRPGKVGIIVGSHRYLCQETAEISFRSWFREHAPDFRLLETLVNLEESRIAYEATLELLARNPDLVGLYIAGGGIAGALEAAREEARLEPLLVVCNELTPTTRAALIDGILTAVIHTRTGALAERTIEAMTQALAAPSSAPPGQILVPFDLYIAENI